MKIAFLVTHLLGTGHLARTAQIADAFAEAGHDALVISGGAPALLAAPKRAALQQLAPVRSDVSFSALYDANGNVMSDDALAARIEGIRSTISGFSPDVLVTELFPFGRRKLAAEFEAAIAASGGALILASIRDILQIPSKAKRKTEAEDRLASHYNGVLFHGDSELVALTDSWPLPASLGSLVLETGYIGEGDVGATETDDGHGEILVAAGGGAVGDALFAASVEAAARVPDCRWRVLVGGADRSARIAALGAVSPNVVIEPVRRDFRALLGRCRVAVLQCGYNTAMDVVAARARAVFCPFEGVGETEQLQRARAMADRYGSGILRENALTGATLAEAVAAASDAAEPDFAGLRLGGAARSVGIVEAALAARR